MAEETDTPFETDEGVVVFQSVGLALCFFDEFTVRHTGSRPVFWEMVGVDLQKRAAVATADDDVFAVLDALLGGTHRAPTGIDTFLRHKIAHSAGVGGRDLRRRNKMRDGTIQSRNDACFEMFRHRL